MSRRKTVTVTIEYDFYDAMPQDIVECLADLEERFRVDNLPSGALWNRSLVWNTFKHDYDNPEDRSWYGSR